MNSLPTFIIRDYQRNFMSTYKKFSFSSTFNWEDNHLPALLKPIPFYTTKIHDIKCTKR